METPIPESRRRFLQGLTACGAGALLAPAAYAQDSPPDPDAREKKEEHEEELVTPGEDLMREHGVLNRVLLVYEECLRRIDAREELDPQNIVSAADVVRRFIEDYHEKLEEEHLFPLFRKAGTLTELVDTLRTQHDAGRRLTDRIRTLATPATLRDEAQARQLTEAIRRFVRMYRPHEAREDTVLFPAIQGLMTPESYAALGERFEEREHELFGEGGFHEWVDRVANIEKALDIHDLARFTPPQA